jgi:hypothetical protein
LDETRVVLPGPLDIAPAPQGVLRNEREDPIGGAFAAFPRSETFGASQLPVTLDVIGIARGVQLARLTFFPLRQVGERVYFVEHIKVRVSWREPVSSSAPAADRMHALIQNQVRNPQHVIPQRLERRSSPTTTHIIAPMALLMLSDTAIYQLTYDDMRALGLHAVNPQTLRLFQGPLEIAGEWEGDGDAIFETDETLFFYVEPRFSRWIHGDVIRLVDGDVPGLRMQTRNAGPAGLDLSRPWLTQDFEENRRYTPDRFLGKDVPAGRDGERWIWDDLTRAWGETGHISGTYSFELPNVAAAHGATLTVWLIGYTDVAGRPDHRVALDINDTPLGEAQWNGRRAITVTQAIPGGILQPGRNTLALRLVASPGVDLDGVWLDAFAVSYRYAAQSSDRVMHFTGQGAPHAYTVVVSNAATVRAYDVTRPRTPCRLTGIQVDDDTVTLGDTGETPAGYSLASAGGVMHPAQVRLPEDVWRLDPRPHAGADVIFITPPTFADALRPLVDWRESQGLSSVMVNVLGIYDYWGDGRPDPQAIHAFLVDAYATWQPRPTYVVLVGDGSFDPKGYQHSPLHNIIPPYLASVDPWAGETAADNRYACVHGDDPLPDLLIGRLPGQSPGEIQTIVTKTLAYERRPAPGGWNVNVALVADDADASGDFAASAEATAPYLTIPFMATRYYCAGTDPYGSDCSAAETRVLHQALLSRWQRGALVTQFFGHASWHQWGAERFFHLDDVPHLGNRLRLPVVVAMTCFTGAFHRPEPTLDEGLVKAAEGGAIVAWGATGLGVNTGHEQLAHGFFQAVFSDTVATVGEATFQGKLTLAASGAHQDLLDTFGLLGDPALKINREFVPWPYEVWLPMVMR